MPTATSRSELRRVSRKVLSARAASSMKRPRPRASVGSAPGLVAAGTGGAGGGEEVAEAPRPGGAGGGAASVENRPVARGERRRGAPHDERVHRTPPAGRRA